MTTFDTMKYFPILFIALFLSACGGDDNDHLTIEEYVEQENLVTEETFSGLNYIIHEPGGDEKPTLDSNITIDYTGYFLGGANFDQGTDVTFLLQNLILGWQEGIRLVGKGGRITLLIPSRFAYGAQGSGSIPGDTDIGFDITLHDFD